MRGQARPERAEQQAQRGFAGVAAAAVFTGYV